MTTLVGLVGWWYGALPLMAVGAVYAVRGARRGWHGLRGAVHGDASQLVPLMAGFRTCILGLALVGISAAWIWQRPVLLLLSIAIAAGETMETSLILFALRHGAHLEYGRPRARTLPSRRAPTAERGTVSADALGHPSCEAAACAPLVKEARSSGRPGHIPTDLVVAQEASDVESSSRLDFLLLHNFRRRFVA